MDDNSDKWTVIVYDKQDKVAHKTFNGEEKVVNEQAEAWVDRYFSDYSWTIHHQTNNYK